MPYKNIELRRENARQYRDSHREKIRKYQREYQTRLRSKRTEEEKEKYNLLQKSYRDKKKRPQKTCIVCGILFDPVGNFKTCSDECKKKNIQAKNKRNLEAFLRNHPDHYQERLRKYRESRGDKFRPRNMDNKLTPTERSTIWRRNNRERYNKSRKDWRNRNNYKNTDAYFKYIFSSGSKISTNEIPPELLESYKLYVKLKREVRNVKTNCI